MFNNIILFGYLCGNPAFSKCSNGKDKCSFSIAVRRYNNNTDFFNCIAYSPVSGAFKFLKKGSLVILDGRLEQCRKDNSIWYSIIVEKVSFFPRAMNVQVDSEELEIEKIPF